MNGQNSTQPQQNERKYKILVVDDEVDAKELFVTLLSSNPNYVPFSASDGIDALGIAEKEKVDLVLLDIVMPRMDGIQALHEIKGHPEKYGTPLVVMLTNLGGDSAIDKAKTLGADGYILKIDEEPEDLMEKISGFINSIGKQKDINPENTSSDKGTSPEPVTSEIE